MPKDLSEPGAPATVESNGSTGPTSPVGNSTENRPSDHSAEKTGGAGTGSLSSGGSRRAKRKRRRNRNPSTTPTHYGSTAERYEVVDELGRGGWGVVERVIDRQLQRAVAVKRIVPAHDLSESVRDRFLHEAKITSQLQHPGIVPVHELGEGPTGDAYYVMKLLDGQPFRQCIREAHQRIAADGLPIRDAILPLLERFIDVCHAVAYAHQQGVIHRDLKPANVMVGQFGETIVVDWGLAKRLNEPPADRDSRSMEQDLDAIATLIRSDSDTCDQTRDGSIIGTPAYMPPEQANGDIEALTIRSDVYSLGVMLYETLVGRHPFAGNKAEMTLDQVRSGRFVSASQVNQAVPRALSAICDKAMSLDPVNRYPSASELADEVRRFIAGDAVQADQETWLDRVSRWCRRHRTFAVSLAAVLFALLIASSIAGLVIQQSHLAERAARKETETAHLETLQRLGESRRAADAWLIDLSGSLQFYPGLEPVREQLIQEAIAHYQTLRLQSEQAESVNLNPASTAHLKAQRKLELAKVQLRLGDLYRLTEQKSVAAKYYEEASQSLTTFSEADLPDPFTRSERRLQQVNVFVGRILCITTDQPNSDGTKVSANAAADEDRRSQYATHQAWLNKALRKVGVTDPRDLPNGPEQSNNSKLDVEFNENSKSNFTYQLASCAARLNLAMGRTTALASNVTQRMKWLRQAKLWSQWLAQTRGSSADHRLLETTMTELGMAADQLGDPGRAAEIWQDLVEELERLCQTSPKRVDYRQSLAHARLRFAAAKATLATRVEPTSTASTLLQASDEYGQAIDELHLAWSLSDVDGFYRTNLAVAQNNLGLLLTRGDTQQRQRAQGHLERSREILRTMMRDQPTADGIRRFCETSLVLARLKREDSPNSARKLLGEAEMGYQLLQAHGFLTEADKVRWNGIHDDLVKLDSDSFGDDASNQSSQSEQHSMRRSNPVP